jgi:phosphoesterase RecJ-like protein
VTFDATLCVDTSDSERVHAGFNPTGTFAVIDHHISNTNFGTLNWVDGTATAAAEMIYILLNAMDVKITSAIATCLYTGMMTDTGGFRFGNTKEITFRVASDLVACGADPAFIAEKVWDSRSPATVKISALVLSTLKYEFGGRLVWNEVTQEMMRSTGDDEAEPEGLSSEMRSIMGVDVAVLFYETPEGFCRIGFRSRGDTNVSAMASLVGGGGHKNASGAYIPEDYATTRDRALGVIREFLKYAWR